MGFKNGGVKTDADDVLRGIESGRIVVKTSSVSGGGGTQDVNIASSDIPLDVNVQGTADVNIASTSGPIESSLVDEVGNPYSYYNPVPVTDGRIISADVNENYLVTTNWTGDFFNLLENPFSASFDNSTSDAVKTLFIPFNYTQKSLQVALGCNNATGWKNIKISLVGSGNVVRALVDKSQPSDPDYNQVVNSANYEFENELFNALLIEFYTTTPVSLTNISIHKSSYSVSQIQGRTTSGRFRTANISDNGNIVTENAGIDIFGNTPMAEQYSTWDGTRIFSYLIPLFWTDYINGAGAANTYDKVKSKNVLSVTNNGDIAATQTKRRIKYQPLKAHKSAYTGIYSQEAGVEKFVGLADLDDYDEPTIDGTIRNGIGYMVTETTIKAQIYNNSVLTESVDREDWNYDKLDGSGPSGFVLDLNSAQIGLTEIEWLGVGACQFYMNIGGRNIPVHKAEHANEGFADVYMRTANLPILYMIKSVGGAGSMDVICNAIVSGGGHNPIGVPRVAVTADRVPVSNGVQESILFIRLKPEAYEATVNVRGIDVMAETSGDSEIELLFNPTWSGGTLTWVDAPNSHIQVAQATGDNVITDKGIPLDYLSLSSDSDSNQTKLNSKLTLGKTLQTNANQTGRYDVMALAVVPVNTSESYRGSIKYEDIT